MAVDRAEMGVVFKGAVVGETDFGGAFEFMDGFVRLAAESVDTCGNVDGMMEMEDAAF